MYNCGVTVYDYAHIGNLRSYTFADILRRYLECKGYEVKQVMNFTDVGHMLKDADVGEDKMEVAMERENKTPWEIADFYIKEFLEDSKLLNFEEPMVRPRATEHVKEIIDLIQKLIRQEVRLRRERVRLLRRHEIQEVRGAFGEHARGAQGGRGREGSSTTRTRGTSLTSRSGYATRIT